MPRTAIEILNERDHPLRRALVEELHVRRFPSFAAPLEMTQIVMFTADMDPAQVRHHAEALSKRFGIEQPIKGRYFSAQLPGLHFVWESHTEFSTYSFIPQRVLCRSFQEAGAARAACGLGGCVAWANDSRDASCRAGPILTAAG